MTSPSFSSSPPLFPSEFSFSFATVFMPRSSIVLFAVNN